MMEEIFRRSKDKQMVYLHVNKQNTGSIAAYEKMGFSIVGSPVTEIGGGFVMGRFTAWKDLFPPTNKFIEPCQPIGACAAFAEKAWKI